jgi:hypothetical protein
MNCKYDPYKDFFETMEENSNKPYIFDIKCRTSFKDVYMNLELPSMKTLDNTIDDSLYIEWTKHIGSNPIHSINIEFPNYGLILKENLLCSFIGVR